MELYPTIKESRVHWVVWNGLRASPPRGTVKRKPQPIVTPVPFMNSLLASRFKSKRRARSCIRDISVLRSRWVSEVTSEKASVLEPPFSYSHSRHRGELPSQLYL